MTYVNAFLEVEWKGLPPTVNQFSHPLLKVGMMDCIMCWLGVVFWSLLVPEVMIQ